MRNFTAVFELAEEGGYVCWAEEIPEAHSQGETLHDARENLIDAIRLILEDRRQEAKTNILALQSKHITVIKEQIPLSIIAI